MIRFLQSPILTAEEGISHGFSTRAGLSAGDLEADLLVTCRQVHSVLAVTVEEAWPENAKPQADALVTNRRGLALGILTADCAPVLFADAQAQVVGAAHAGWRGALGGVLENTLAAMEVLGADRRRVRAAIGPCIGAASYEVGPEFQASFLKEDGKNEVFFQKSTKEGCWMFDLPAYVECRLRMAGVADVGMPPGDTSADEARFFSYRRGCLTGVKETGRQISAIVLI